MARAFSLSGIHARIAYRIICLGLSVVIMNGVNFRDVLRCTRTFYNTVVLRSRRSRICLQP